MAMKFYLFLNRFLSTSAVRKQFSYPDFPREFEAASIKKPGGVCHPVAVSYRTIED